MKDLNYAYKYEKYKTLTNFETIYSIKYIVKVGQGTNNSILDK